MKTTPTDRFVRERSWDRRECPSPAGSRTFVFRDPFEWHMGAAGWKSSLFENGREITGRHKALARLAGRKGFVANDGSVWSADGRTLALITWEADDPVCLYDVDCRRVTRVPTGREAPRSALWSPHGDRLLIVFHRRALIVDAAARPIASANWESLPHGEHVYWYGADEFLVVAKESRQSKSTITRYRSDTGDTIGAEDLDPIDLFPYDSQAFADVSREGFTLLTGPGTRTVGAFLDVWGGSQHIAERGLLLLSTYRPTALPSLVDGQPMCPAAIRWLEVELR